MQTQPDKTSIIKPYYFIKLSVSKNNLDNTLLEAITISPIKSHPVQIFTCNNSPHSKWHKIQVQCPQS